MYQRILLAYDGAADGGLAVREGALLAKQCCAHLGCTLMIARSHCSDEGFEAAHAAMA